MGVLVALSVAMSFNFFPSDIGENFHFSYLKLPLFKMSRVESIRGKGIKLSQIPPPSDADIFLDFESTRINLKNYDVVRSDFYLNPNSKVFGFFSGKFFRPEHFIEMIPKRFAFFYERESVGSFTISFWFEPYRIFNGGRIFDFRGSALIKGKEVDYGIFCSVENNRVVWEMKNVFYDDEGNPKTVILSEENELIPDEWHHHALSYDAMSGKLVVSKDGEEVRSLFMTSDGTRGGTILVPSFRSFAGAYIRIGKGIVGNIDRFVVERRFTDSFDTGRYVKSGYFISDVISFPSPVVLKEIRWKAGVPDKTVFRVFVRSSKKYFLPSDPLPKWKGLVNGEKLNVSARYVQFAFKMYSDPHRIKSPVFKALSFFAEPDFAPSVPMLVKLVPMDGAVRVVWKGCVEDDVVGYKIYYGKKSGVYWGESILSGNSPIFVRAVKGKENYEFVIKGLNNDQPYFVSVTAVDSSGNESGFSRELWVVPSDTASTVSNANVLMY